MEGFLSKKEKATKADNRLMMKFGKHQWRVKLYLTNVLQLIINSLDQRSFPKHNLVSCWSIKAFFTDPFSDAWWGGLRQWRAVRRGLSRYSPCLRRVSRRSVCGSPCVSRGFCRLHCPESEEKPEQFTLVINDQVEFESIEPPKRAFPFPGKFLEGFMLLFSFDMAASDGSRIDKRYAGTLPQSLHF